MSKPGKSLRNLCKKLGVRLTIKRGQKRVYKSVAVLKRQCANKKKKKKVKRKRRKFGTKRHYSRMNNPGSNERVNKQHASELAVFWNMITNPSFKQSDLDLIDADLYGANLQGADLSNLKLQNTNLYGADLEGADLRGANLRKADLRKADLKGANLGITPSKINSEYYDYEEGTDLSGADLSGADLRGAIFNKTSLYKAVLKEAKLQGADLRGVNLNDANLEEADLRGVNLARDVEEEGYLEETNLKGANLQHSILTNVWFPDTSSYDNTDFRYANLQNAHFAYDMDLRGAKLHKANLKGAQYGPDVQFPKYFFPEDHGMILNEDYAAYREPGDDERKEFGRKRKRRKRKKIRKRKRKVKKKKKSKK